MAKKVRKYASARQEVAQGEQGKGPTGLLKVPAGVKFFKPDVGRYKLIVVPYVVGAGNPNADEGSLYYKRQFWAHRRVGPDGEDVVCLKEFGKRCPVCMRRQTLTADGDGSEETQREIDSLTGSKRMLLHVIDVADQALGVQLWEVSHHCFGKLLNERIDGSEEEDKWDNFFHFEGGKTLVVNFVKESFGQHKYIKASSIDFRDRKDLDEDKWLPKTYCLDELLLERSRQEVVAILNGEEPEADDTGSDDDDDEADFSPTKGAAKKQAAKKPAKKAKPEADIEDDSDLDDDDVDTGDGDDLDADLDDGLDSDEEEPEVDDSDDEGGELDDDIDDGSDDESEPPKRGRGRPPKAEAKAPAKATAKRGRGRPPKAEAKPAPKKKAASEDDDLYDLDDLD